MSLVLRSAVLAAALWGAASAAFAHAPLPRGLALSPDGTGIAVRMPGFGLLVRTPESAPEFRYVCDALAGVRPIEEHVAMAYRSDGALLLGTAQGVFVLGADGCPLLGSPTIGPTIEALAVHASDRVYAAIVDTQRPASFARSDDGGQSWDTLSSTLDSAPISALVVDDADPNRLLATQASGPLETTLSVSSDGGESFESFPQGRALTLVRVQGDRLWATERIPNQGVGVSILRASQPQGPWTEVLQVNFFGGLAVDPEDADVIWIGDEARGVFRSSDGGDSFEETQPGVASSCLEYGAGALWACTPGLPTDSALASSPDALRAFEPAMAFADVDQLVACAPELKVEQVCHAAWVEWQRDVLGVMPATPDAGTTNEPDASVANEPDAGTPPMADASNASGGSGGCSCRVTATRDATRASSPLAWLLAASLIALRSTRRRRRDCDRRACPHTSARPHARPAPPASRPR